METFYETPEFFQNVLFTDESTFRKDGIINRYNRRYYRQENPHWLGEKQYQGGWSVNVWGGLLDDQVVGPYFFNEPLTANRYLHFLREVLPLLLENVNLEVRGRMWFQQDGAPVHNTNDVTNFLRQTYGNRFIGNKGTAWYENQIDGEGPILWPPRSPDLSPLDYFFWGLVKDRVYATPCNTKEEMKNRIREAFASVTVEMLRNTQNNFIKRANICLAAEGGIFEHMLK